MRIFDRIVKETNEKKILKNSAVLNGVAGIISSTFISVLMMIITRLGNIDHAGAFSIASVIVYQCLTIGSFATYNVQTADLKREFHLNDYIGIRLISSVFMILLLLCYSFGSGYSDEKAWIIFSFGLFKLSDIVDDLFRAEYHRNHRLDIASSILIARYMLALLLFSISFISTRNLVLTLLVSSAFLMFFTLMIHLKYVRLFVKEKIKFCYNKVKLLFYILLPLTISNYIRMYVMNVPKYAIDLYLTSADQVYFGILMMPAMIINLLSEIVFAAFIPRLAEYWEKDVLLFYKLIVHHLIVILCITIFMVFGAWIIGLDLLSFIFAVDLKGNMFDLIVLLLAGCFNAASLFMTLALTIQRKQKLVVVLYVPILFLALCISKYALVEFGINGASLLYFAICCLNFIGFGTIVLCEIRKKARGVSL